MGDAGCLSFGRQGGFRQRDRERGVRRKPDRDDQALDRGGRRRRRRARCACDEERRRNAGCRFLRRLRDARFEDQPPDVLLWRAWLTCPALPEAARVSPNHFGAGDTLSSKENPMPLIVLVLLPIIISGGVISVPGT